MRHSRPNTAQRLMCGAAAIAILSFAGAAQAEERAFTIEPQSLSTALAEFGAQSGHAVMAPMDLLGAKTTRGFAQSAEPEIALAQLLDGTGLTYRKTGDTFAIVSASDPQSGSAAGDGADQGTVQALIVTAQKREENIQDVPIAMSAFTQEALERSQVAGGPDLMTQVPNMTFTKTNFSSYSIQIRGIGTQAISATTDAAVAVAFNNTPFIRNRFFEQEFYDLQRVEVLRGPQGTLYGRNATAGVVNLISQKPKFTYEAKLSADVANYSSRRIEGMVNVPLVDDKAALRLAGAWTKRDGYATNQLTGNPIDGRDLWSTRVSLRVSPTERIDANLIWEHFQENDDRLRSGKQLCHTDNVTEVVGLPVDSTTTLPGSGANAGGFAGAQASLSQGCSPASLYSLDSFQTPNGQMLPYYLPLGAIGLPIPVPAQGSPPVNGLDPYASRFQSHDLRVIESTVDPKYRAKSDVIELQFKYDITDALTLTSETGYSSDFIFSTQDFNRFNTAAGAFRQPTPQYGLFYDKRENWLLPGPNGGVFCDPQIGCADRLVGVDLSTAKSRQFSQEFRLASNYEGPFNFSLGANFLRYDTEDKYYVFFNTLTMIAAKQEYAGGSSGGRFTPPGAMPPWQAGVSDNHECMRFGFLEPDPLQAQNVRGCAYIDPNPIDSLNDLGHNYFLSKNPYKLISYAVFGEAYYQIAPDLKLTAGLRWTVDKKEAPRIPSWVLAADTVGYPVAEVIDQEWREPTGRLTIDWKPDLAFTDQTLLYASFAHGYKAGGANPPRAGIVCYSCSVNYNLIAQQSATKPKTFDPEFVNAFEVGSKNTLLDGKLTLNAAAFYYDYTGYQISQIVDRSAVNLNFDAKVWGLELEADWRPLENLRLGFKGGYEDTRVAKGEKAVDIMDRTAGHPGWVVLRPEPTGTTNCILPAWLFVATADGFGAPTAPYLAQPGDRGEGSFAGCEIAYISGYDPVTNLPYVPNPTVGAPTMSTLRLRPGYPGWDPSTAPNNGEGFDKDLSGHQLPNAPHFTATVTADYTVPLPSDWLMTLHTDLYYQSEAWTRIFNMPGYDKLKAYTNVNLAAIFTNNDAGWKVMAYVKNVFDRDSITGAFLNSDDTGLTTNVFLTEPRLYGLRVTKEFQGGPWWIGANPNHSGPWPLTVELGGEVQHWDAPKEVIEPEVLSGLPPELELSNIENRRLDWGDGRSVKLTYQPGGSPWSVSGAFRYGRTNSRTSRDHHELRSTTASACGFPTSVYGGYFYNRYCSPSAPPGFRKMYVPYTTSWSEGAAWNHEEHTIVDFDVGRDVGFGAPLSASTLSAGLRYGDFSSASKLDATALGGWYLPEGWALNQIFPSKYQAVHNGYNVHLTAERRFKGAGPTLSWDAASPLLGSEASGHLNLDWSVTGGVLFGKQTAKVSGEQDTRVYSGDYLTFPFPQVGATQVTPPPGSRSKSVSVPVVDLSLGLSYDIQRLKVSTGYRWERYFNVLDTGYAERKQADRTIDGPYFKITVGFGG